MNGRAAPPSLSLERITCVIRCCACPPAASDEIDGECKSEDGRSDEEGSKCSRNFEKNLHGSEKPSKFFLPYRLYSEAKKFNSKIKLKDVIEWLETQKSYTLHRRLKTKFKRRKVLTRGIQYQYQADLVDYAKLKRDNSGYTFVLSVIDCFSRLAFAIPIKRKTGEEVAAVLRRAFDNMGDPKKLHTDQGKEFYNRYVKELLHERGVHHFSTFQDVKAQIVEQFNRTLREAILQYMTD